MRQKLPLILGFLTGLFALVEFYVPAPPVHAVQSRLLEMASILAAAAFILGGINVIQVNVPHIRRRQADWQYKVVLVAGALLMLVAGVVGGPSGRVYTWLYDHVFAPCNSTMFALLAFFVASSAFRAFRARNLEAGLLLGAAILVMLGRVPIGRAIADWLPAVSDWIIDIPNNAGRRAIMMGAAIGAIATSLRVILGLERSHLGGGGP